MLSKIFFPILGIALGIFILLLGTFSPKWIILFLSLFTILAIFIMLKDSLDVTKVFLVLMIIDMNLLIDSHIYSDNNVLSSVPGLHISITTIALTILYLLWWIDIIVGKSKKVEFFPKMTIVALAYISSYLISIYNSISIAMTIFSIFFLAQMFMVYFYIANYIKSKEDLIYILNILLVCLYIQAVTILIQYSTQTQFNFTGGFSSVDSLVYFHEGKLSNVYRPVGTGGDPNDAGGQISMLLLIILSLLFYTKSYLKNILIWVVLLIGTAALILTFSRGSWLAFTGGLVVFLFVALRHRRITAKKIVAIAVLIAIVLGVLSVPIAARLTQDDRGSAYSRVPLMKLAFNMIQEHPFIGVGGNNFGIVLSQYLSSELRGEWLHLVHNQYLLIFAETGVIGTFFFLLIIAIVMCICLRCISAKDPILSPTSIGVASAVIAISLHMAVELSVSRMTVQLFWIMVSIASASERLIRITRDEVLDVKPDESGISNI